MTFCWFLLHSNFSIKYFLQQSFFYFHDNNKYLLSQLANWQLAASCCLLANMNNK